MRYLLDTCVISELVARKPSQLVVDWIDSVDSESVYLSVITVGEIRKGIEKLEDSKRKSVLLEWLDDDLLRRFSGRILPIDLETILLWGQMMGRLESKGKKMPAMDSLLAAVASHGNLTLVTRNVQDFASADIELLNPWSASE